MGLCLMHIDLIEGFWDLHLPGLQDFHAMKIFNVRWKLLLMVGYMGIRLHPSRPLTFQSTCKARLAQPVERKALNLVVVGSSPTVGDASKSCGAWRSFLCLMCIYEIHT